MPSTCPARPLRRAQDGRLPLHIAARQQGDEAETVVKLLLNAHPAGAKEKDNVRCRSVAAILTSHPCASSRRSLRMASPPSRRLYLSARSIITQPLPCYRKGTFPWVWPCKVEALFCSSLCWSRVRPLGSLMSISTTNLWLAPRKSRSSSPFRTNSTQTHGGSSASSACTRSPPRWQS